MPIAIKAKRPTGTAAAGIAMVDSHSSRLTVKTASTTKIDNAMACPLVLTGSMAAVATAAICRLTNSLSDKLPGVISSPNRVLIQHGQGSDMRYRPKRRKKGKAKRPFGRMTFGHESRQRLGCVNRLFDVSAEPSG